MRFTIGSVVVGLLASTVQVAADPKVNCWGKATHPTWEALDKALGNMKYAIEHPMVGPDGELPPTIYAAANAGQEAYCVDKVSIRWDNLLPHGRYLPLTKIAQDVQTLLDECIAYNEEGERIAGGAVDHVDDNFITVAQLVDECWTN